jgi:hypothetical protein
MRATTDEEAAALRLEELEEAVSMAAKAYLLKIAELQAANPELPLKTLGAKPRLKAPVCSTRRAPGCRSGLGGGHPPLLRRGSTKGLEEAL